ncbi:MAG: dUTP diphosphatase [Erysipelotrichaceae bacterium]|nr:dUTP diphosphatase [Erysipelotrichaceae bacterium]
MSGIAAFEKVSFGQFAQDTRKRIGDLPEGEIREAYEKIVLPHRASRASAGYDFVTPYEITINPQKMVVIPSGIRVRIDYGFVLELYPRSSLGIKRSLALANTVGIIDADYYEADNEGHILIALRNLGSETVVLQKGERIVQGIFKSYYLAEEEEVTGQRTGGLGSSGK